jgi:hypothetical protein
MIREKRKNPIRTILIVSISLVIGITYFYVFYTEFPVMLYIRALVSHSVKEARQDRERLLCKTDYRILLDACRDILKQVDKGELKPGKYYVRRDPSPEVSHFPKQILDLKPSCIYVHDRSCISLEMLGGLDHFGVKAYSEDFNKSSPDYVYRDRKLIEGLWYYDDGYRGNPEYDKVIDEVINKNKK